MCMHEQWQLYCTSRGWAVVTIEWACIVSVCHIQNAWASRVINLHQNFMLSLNIALWKVFGWLKGFQGQCKEWRANESVAQAYQRWSRICWKWSTFWKAWNKQAPENAEGVWAAINKDQRLAVRPIFAHAGLAFAHDSIPSYMLVPLPGLPSLLTHPLILLLCLRFTHPSKKKKNHNITSSWKLCQIPFVLISLSTFSHTTLFILL